MPTLPTVLCAVDYSAASRTALRYAASAVNYISGRLVVLSVIDPLLAEAMVASGHQQWQETERGDLRAFCQEAVGPDPALHFEVDVCTGKPAEEILAAAGRLQPRLIVMGCHGLTGIRKMFFGSTTERVLRDTPFPVLVAPANPPVSGASGDLAALIRHIVVPVDLTEDSYALASIGTRIGANIGVPTILVHVIEPLTLRARWRGQLPSMQSEARNRAETAINRLVDGTTGTVEPLIVFGEPADEIARVAEIRAAGLVVMGLQHGGSGRVGVVAYRILTSTKVPVLAVPGPMVSLARGQFRTPAKISVGSSDPIPHICRIH